MKITVLVLDMDGVIVDTEPLHMAAFQQLLERYGINAADDFLLSFIGHSVEENVRSILKEFSLKPRPSPQKMVHEREQIYLDLLKSNPLSPMDGLISLIEFCDQKSIKLGMATSSPQTQISAIFSNIKLHNAIDLNTIFTAIVSGDDVPRKKPAPDIYQRIVKKLSADPACCLAVEDSPAGIKSARSAGLLAAGYRTAMVNPLELKDSDYLVSNFKEIKSLLKRLI